MKRSRFVPEDFSPSEKNAQWAMDELGVDESELAFQVSLMTDHEFKTPYSDWQRVFRNWMKNAVKWRKNETHHTKPESFSDKLARLEARANS